MKIKKQKKKNKKKKKKKKKKQRVIKRKLKFQDFKNCLEAARI